LVFTPDGKRLAAGSYILRKGLRNGQEVDSHQGQATLWDMTTGLVAATLNQEQGPIFVEKFLDENQVVILTTQKKLPDAGQAHRDSSSQVDVKVWNVDSGQERTILSIPAFPEPRPALSPDLSVIAAMTEDARNVNLWDVAKKQKRAT